MFRNKTVLQLLICAVAVASTSVGFAETADVYVSFSDLGGPFAPGNSVANFNVGDSGSAFIWVNDSQDIDTLQVTDVILSNATTIALTNAMTFNYDIISNEDGTEISDRWDSVGHGIISPTGDSVSGLFGFNNTIEAPGSGIRLVNRGDVDGSTALDLGYDTTNGTNSFLFARIDFVATGTGSASILPAGFFLNGGVFNNDLVVAGGTVNVVNIPEPASGLLLVLGLGLAASRRSR